MHDWYSCNSSVAVIKGIVQTKIKFLLSFTKLSYQHSSICLYIYIYIYIGWTIPLKQKNNKKQHMHVIFHYRSQTFPTDGFLPFSTCSSSPTLPSGVVLSYPSSGSGKDPSLGPEGALAAWGLRVLHSTIIAALIRSLTHHRKCHSSEGLRRDMGLKHDRWQ